MSSRAKRKSRPQAVLAELLDDMDTGKTTPARIHRVRVNVKKLRGWIRLLRFAEGRRIGVSADRDLRAIAHQLAQARDGDVARQTLRLLRAECEGTRERAALTALARRLVRPRQSLAMPAASGEAVRRLRRLVLRQTTADRMEAALARSYRRARRLGKRGALADASPELRHRWRKRVKYLYYQVRLANVADERRGARWRRSLDELGTVLGEMQDLHVFERQLAQLDEVSDATLALARRPLERARRRRAARLPGYQRRCFARRRSPFPA